MSGEVYLASKNLLINAKSVVIEKRRKPVRDIKTAYKDGSFRLTWAEENFIFPCALSSLTRETQMIQGQL